jgi:hypothetical protein
LTLHSLILSLSVYLFLSCKLSLSFSNSLCHSFSFFVTLSLSLFLFSFLCHTLSSSCHSLSCHTRFLTFYLPFTYTLLVCHTLCYLFVTFSMSLSKPLFLCHTSWHSLFVMLPFSHTLSLSPIHIICFVTLFFLLWALSLSHFLCLCHYLSSFATLYCILFLSHSLFHTFSPFHIHISCLPCFSFFFVLSLCHFFYVFVTTSLPLSHFIVFSFVTLPFSHFRSPSHSHYLFLTHFFLIYACSLSHFVFSLSHTHSSFVTLYCVFFLS